MYVRDLILAMYLLHCLALNFSSRGALIVWAQQFHSTIFVEVVHSDYIRALDTPAVHSAHVIAFKHKRASAHKSYHFYRNYFAYYNQG